MGATIWYVSKYVTLPFKGGPGTRGFMLMREFSKLGYECVLITSDSNHLTEAPELKTAYEIQNIDGVYVHWIRTLKYKATNSARRFLSWLHFEWRLWRMPNTALSKPDVIIVSSLSPLTILNGLLWRKVYKCRLVYEIRDIWPLTITEEGGFSKTNPLVLVLEWIEKLGYRRADIIVGTMPNLAEHVANQVGLGRPVFCIPMGIDPTTSYDNQSLPSDYEMAHIPLDKFVVGYVGSIGITNALDVLMKCAADMADNQDIHFLLVGEGDSKKEYMRKYKSLPNITFAPGVPKQMVQSVLKHCDLLYFSVHNSKVWRYGQSLNKIIDYMLAGRPIIASFTGYQSMLNEAESGSFVPAGDASALRYEIERYAFMSDQERNLIGIRGRDWLFANRIYKTLANKYLAIIFPSRPIV